MRHLGTLTVLGLVAVALSACGGLELGRAKKVTPEGVSAFNFVLYDGYIARSQAEFNEGDYKDSDSFAARAIAAGTGQMVLPEEISARNLPAGTAPELQGARNRLTAALDATAREKAAAHAANAQVAFDCWMQEQEENRQPAHIEACKKDFLAAMNKVDTALKPKPMAMAPAPAPKPKPEKPKGSMGPFIVYFDFDDSTLSAAEKAALNEVAWNVILVNPTFAAIGGHTDRAGSDRYNMALGAKRAQVVADYLKAAGISPKRIAKTSYGERQPKVPTADGVRESKNRRAEIIFLK